MTDPESGVGNVWDLEVPFRHGAAKDLSPFKVTLRQPSQKSEHKLDLKKKNTEPNSESYHLSSEQLQSSCKKISEFILSLYPKEFLTETLWKYKTSNARIPHRFQYLTGVDF